MNYLHTQYKFIWSDIFNFWNMQLLRPCSDRRSWRLVLPGCTEQGFGRRLFVEARCPSRWAEPIRNLRSQLLLSQSVVSNSLQPHGLQLTRLLRPSPFPGLCSDSCPLSQWCHPTISSSSRPLLLLPSIFPSIRVFSNELALHIKWPRDWSFSFSISPSSDNSGLISFRID